MVGIFTVTQSFCFCNCLRFYKNYNTLSIKKHYKAKKKANRRGISLKKVAIGVAAIAGIALILLPEDDDSSFRF